MPGNGNPGQAPSNAAYPGVPGIFPANCPQKPGVSSAGSPIPRNQTPHLRQYQSSPTEIPVHTDFGHSCVLNNFYNHLPPNG